MKKVIVVLNRITNLININLLDRRVKEQNMP